MLWIGRKANTMAGERVFGLEIQTIHHACVVPSKMNRSGVLIVCIVLGLVGFGAFLALHFLDKQIPSPAPGGAAPGKTGANAGRNEFRGPQGRHGGTVARPRGTGDPWLELKRLDADEAAAILRQKEKQPSLGELMKNRDRMREWLISQGYSETQAGERLKDMEKYLAGEYNQRVSLPISLMAVLNRFREFLFLPSLEGIGADAARVFGKNGSVRFLMLGTGGGLSAEVAEALGGSKRNLFLTGLTSLSPDTADALAKGRFPILSLTGLADLSPEAAGILAQNNAMTESLILPSLRKLDARTASVLANGKLGYLLLPNLSNLSEETAAALSGFKGKKLVLSGLTSLNAALVDKLLSSGGFEVDLSGIATMDAETATALVTRTSDRSLNLPGLTSLDPAVMGALAKVPVLKMSGLSSLDVTAARVLAQGEVSQLHLPGLRSLSAEAVSELIKKERLEMYTDVRMLDADTIKVLCKRQPSARGQYFVLVMPNLSSLEQDAAVNLAKAGVMIHGPPEVMKAQAPVIEVIKEKREAMTEELREKGIYLNTLTAEATVK
jgi:hypothetical protein